MKIFKFFLILVFSVLIYSVCIEPFWIQVKEVSIDEEPFSSFFKKNKTVFISDIHVSRFGIREKILQNKLSNILPDIIILGGDYVSWGGDYGKAFEFLRDLNAQNQVLGVLGDSDYQKSRKSCQFCHNFDRQEDALPIRFLQNQKLKLGNIENPLCIVGLDPFPIDRREKKEIIDSTISGPSIVVSQKQLQFEELPDHKLLILSGDTHGGQIGMPDWLWRKAFQSKKGRLRAGITKQKDKILIVTAGIGTNVLPLRLLAPPEIILFKGK